MKVLVVVAALAMGGCVFDQSVVGRGTDADPFLPDADPTAADADLDLPDADPSMPDADPALPDAAPPTGLVDTGLVVRYYMDEAASGNSPANLIDSAPSPLALPITYGATTYTEDNGNRGLHWPSVNGEGKAQINLGTNKLATRLGGARTVTIEVVTKIDSAGTNGEGSNIAGLRGGNPDFMLVIDGDFIRFHKPFGPVGASWNDVNTSERMVLHLVWDTTGSNSDNYIRLYKNGTLISKATSAPPNMNSSVGLGASDSLIIGNRPASNRSIEGTIYYTAMYDEALSASDVATNAASLLANDDAPP